HIWKLSPRKIKVLPLRWFSPKNVSAFQSNINIKKGAIGTFSFKRLRADLFFFGQCTRIGSTLRDPFQIGLNRWITLACPALHRLQRKTHLNVGKTEVSGKIIMLAQIAFQKLDMIFYTALY